ncbi:unnamed protein product [Angiostrongylus costaricensis]|uniref:TPR_REGION domain-containing protein n=1 Tax=Angiostrongylus costaricensis TaxID=334426 RepID=A0A0R3PDA1_ANGCS|nr:unnamed protein product [Angiostrongylus costaricensis]
MSIWRQQGSIHAQDKCSVIPSREALQFRYSNVAEAAIVLENALIMAPSNKQHSPLPPGFWGNFPDIPLVRERSMKLPVIRKPQRRFGGTTKRISQNDSMVFLRNNIRTISPNEDTKEEILTITSPSLHHEDQNDSGIENRTTDSHSPSTSLDFSPRSDSKHTPDRLISSKVSTAPSTTTESSAPPDYPPPPPPPPPLPPPSSSDSTLDQFIESIVFVFYLGIDPAERFENDFRHTAEAEQRRLSIVVAAFAKVRSKDSIEC